MLSATLRYASRPLLRWMLSSLPAHDAWTRFPHPVPTEHFGLGADRPFREYLTLEGAPAVTSLEEALAFAASCTYIRDGDLFGEDDVWQHPAHFEARQEGDCEDFSLWLWATLVHLGYEAEFVVGRCRRTCPQLPEVGHAWVHVVRDDRLYLVDGVLRCSQRMIQPRERVANRYHPEFSVDHELQRYIYGAYLQATRG